MHSTKKYFFNSFFPSTIRLWNKLDNKIKEKPTHVSFKKSLNQSTNFKYYKPHLAGSSKGHIELGRLRVGLSGLNAHRHKYNFIPSSACPTCLNPIEDNTHFILECPTYAAQRTVMLAAISGVLPVTRRLIANRNALNNRKLTNILITGVKKEKTDKRIFNIVSKFILDSRRFK